MVDMSKLGSKHYASMSALSAVLRELREAPELPRHTSRQSLKRAREKALGGSTPYGPLWRTVSLPSGSAGAADVKVEVLSPAAYLHKSGI